MTRWIKIFFGLSLTLAIVTSTFLFVAFDLSWYQKEFTKQEVYNIFTKERVDNQVINLFAYLKNNDTLKNDYYSNKEIAHLTDVKKIIQFLRLVNIASAIALTVFGISIIYQSGARVLAKLILNSSSFLFLIIATAIAGLIFNFDQIFYWFHQLVFKNDFWLLDPSIESLVVIFPGNLFFDITARLFMISALINLLIFISAALMHKKLKATPAK